MRKIIIILIALFLATCKDEVKVASKIINSKVEQSEHFCYLTNINHGSDSAFATIDFIEYKKIADVDSTVQISQIIELPNGFCYSNNEILLKSYPFRKNVKIVMQTFSYTKDGNFNFNQIVALNELVDYFQKPEHERILLSPFRITLIDHQISSLTEIYIP